MNTTNLNIVMLGFQPSVVARGLEKKLVEAGNSVTSIVGASFNLDQYMLTTSLFIFNLPTKIADDTEELKTLIDVCNNLLAKGKKMIMVGEKEVWTTLARVYSKTGEFVWVYRPVEMNELNAAIDRALNGKPVKTAGNRILIVDDDPDYARMVRGWIKEFYRVDIVTAGMQAITFLLKAADNEPVDLILLDYEMPVVDGPQVLQMLRQEPATAHIPVVFLTGVGTRESVARVMALHPDGYILKSTTRDDLIAFLDSKLKKVSDISDLEC